MVTCVDFFHLHLRINVAVIDEVHVCNLDLCRFQTQRQVGFCHQRPSVLQHGMSSVWDPEVDYSLFGPHAGSLLSSLSQHLPWTSKAQSLAFHYPMPRACCENESLTQSKPSILETLRRTQKSPRKDCVQKQILSVTPWDSWTLTQNHKAQRQAFLPAGLPAVPLKSRKRNPHWHVPC